MMNGINMRRKRKETGDMARHTDMPTQWKTMRDKGDGRRRARALEAREGKAYGCVRLRVRRRRLSASSKTGNVNEHLQAVVVIMSQVGVGQAGPRGRGTPQALPNTPVIGARILFYRHLQYLDENKLKNIY